MKLPLIMFSGGLDSSVLLANALKYGPVDTLYVKGGQDSRQIEVELRQRKIVMDKINELSPFKVREDYIRTVWDGIEHGRHTQLRFGQILPWLIGSIYTMSPSLHSEVQVGYISGDSTVIAIPEMRAAFKAMQSFMITSGREYPIPLTFPFLDYTKEQMLGFLPTELADDIWVCERPESTGDQSTRAVPCGCCTSCRTHKKALYGYELETGRKWNYKQPPAVVVNKIIEIVKKEKENVKTKPATGVKAARNSRSRGDGIKAAK